VAAIAMSSATYAWFVNNTAVTATDVSVSASTAYSLLISPKGGSNATWGTTTSLAAVTKLTQVSTTGQINDGTSAITLTKASGSGESAVAAVGIGDGETVNVGDVRFVTITDWADNYITAVSEVSRTSKPDGSNYTYFYSDTVWLKAAQEGDICLDSKGIGINWKAYDEKNTDTGFADEKLFSLADFAALPEISTENLGEGTTPTLTAAQEYNEKLTSAQALLKTLRIGLLVTQTSGEGSSAKTSRTWHEYQLVTSNISDSAVNTTKKGDTAANGIAEGVKATDTSYNSTGNVATDSTPVVGSISSARVLTSKTIENYAIESSDSGMAQYESKDNTDVIAEVGINEEVQVDIYIWMEGCDWDTVAAHINDFSGTGVTGLQLGFCLGQLKTSG
jgi:hypothetical protein